ncbi:MAG TPA: acyl-CoA thioester hydrolase/BAAT C-terminal domain-containing protein [Acidimicrobiales bacterium]|nr:acyl-CoA thioester hydrolase/BAAT C-terminal domain-containing protein [Acidimicrobiales bacterium]
MAIGVALVGAGLLWWRKPWVPAVPLADPGRGGQRINEAGVFGNYFASTAPAPGILLLGGSEGGLSHDVARTARAFRRAGFSVLQLAYFGAPHEPSKLERVPLETFDRGLDWLRRQPAVLPDRVALVGHSKGAEAALLEAARRPDVVRAVVAAAPSSVVWKGIDWGFPLNPDSSWSANGKPVPALPYALWRPWKPIGSVYRDGLRRLGEHRKSEIAVERIAGPVLLLCGDRDALWPSCPMSRALRSRAEQRGKTGVSVIEFKTAGHLLFGPRVPPQDPALHNRWTGGSATANNQARAKGWSLVVAFLRQNLAS